MCLIKSNIFAGKMSDRVVKSVDYTIQPIQQQAVWPGVLEKDAMWAFADQGSFKMVLRKTLKNHEKAKKTAIELKEIIEEKFNNQTLYDGFIESLGFEEIEEPEIVIL